MAKILAVGDYRAAVEDLVALVLGEADEYRDTLHTATDFLQGSLDGVPQTGVKQEVLGRVATDAQLGENDQVGVQFVTGFFGGLENARRIALHVANDEIELRKRDGDRVVHPCPRAVLGSQHLLHFTAEFCG